MHRPVHGAGPLVVAVADRRTERLLRERVVEDHQGVGPPSREGRALAGELREVAGPAVALSGRRTPRRSCVGIGERERRVAQPGRVEPRGEVQLGGGAGQHADGGAVHVFDRLEPRVGPHHHPLAVEEGRGEEAGAVAAITAGRVSRVADQHVDLARLQRGETAVSASSGVYSTASASPSTAAATALQNSMSKPAYAPCVVDEAEAGHGLVDAAVERATVLHLGEQAATFLFFATPSCGFLTGIAFTVAARIVVVAAGGAHQGQDGQKSGEREDTSASKHGSPPCRQLAGRRHARP